MKPIWLYGLVFSVMLQAACTTAYAVVRGERIEYKQGEQILEGFLAYDDSVKGKSPGVLIIHEWTGLGAYVENRAKQIAALGYIVFAADIYGKGIRPQDEKFAAEQADIYRRDRDLMRARAWAGLEELRKQANVDAGRITAIGYCFGGGVVLELARSGADISGVVSFHGNLDTPNLNDAKNITAKILVFHGANDPFVTREEVLNFENEMRRAEVDWQLIIYGNAVHSFTNPESGNDPSTGIAYHEESDKRSWEAMKLFFQEIFGKK